MKITYDILKLLNEDTIKDILNWTKFDVQRLSIDALDDLASKGLLNESDWELVSEHKSIPFDFAVKYKHKLNLSSVMLRNGNLLTGEFINTVMDAMDACCLQYAFINCVHGISMDLILKNADRLFVEDARGVYGHSARLARSICDEGFFYMIDILRICKYFTHCKSPSCCERFWEGFSKRSALTEYFIMEYYDYVDWYVIAKYCPNLSERFIVDNLDKLSLIHIGKSCANLSDEFILKNIENMNYLDVFTYKKFNEDMLDKLLNVKTVSFIISFQKPSAAFIDKHEDILDAYVESAGIYEKDCFWRSLLSLQLSERLIKKYADNFNWERVLFTQNVSEEFILENSSRIMPSWVKHAAEYNKWDTAKADRVSKEVKRLRAKHSKAMRKAEGRYARRKVSRYV